MQVRPWGAVPLELQEVPAGPVGDGVGTACVGGAEVAQARGMVAAAPGGPPSLGGIQAQSGPQGKPPKAGGTPFLVLPQSAQHWPVLWAAALGPRSGPPPGSVGPALGVRRMHPSAEMQALLSVVSFSPSDPRLVWCGERWHQWVPALWG